MLTKSTKTYHSTPTIMADIKRIDTTKWWQKSGARVMFPVGMHKIKTTLENQSMAVSYKYKKYLTKAIASFHI